MRRADRLVEIVEIVRDGRLHTAGDLAAALEVSERTIYRDMAALAASGVPVEGERGVGYLLREPVFLSPSALSPAELEALSLGMAIVGEAADPELRAAADSLLGKLEGRASVRRRSPTAWGFGVYAFERARAGFVHMPLLRRAIREGLVLRIAYRSLAGEATERTIRPLRADYWGRVWTCSAWCELRGEFRAFRIDRIETCTEAGRPFAPEPGKTIEDYLRHVADRMDPERAPRDRIAAPSGRGAEGSNGNPERPTRSDRVG